MTAVILEGKVFIFFALHVLGSTENISSVTLIFFFTTSFHLTKFPRDLSHTSRILHSCKAERKAALDSH